MAETAITDASIREIERITKDGLDNNAKLHQIHGQTFSTTSLNRIPGPEAQPVALTFNTLQGIADFARSKVSEYAKERGGLFLLIEDPGTICLYTGIFGDFAQRVKLGEATATVAIFDFTKWHKGENFTVALLSQFAATPDRETVFRLTGAVVSGSSIATDDDGVSQNVTVKRGIDRVKESIGPGRLFHLAPFSTFSEVAQPQRPFILRMQPGNANAVPPEQHSCALVEADGGLWKIEAIASVKEWLVGELDESVPVYG